MDGDEPQDLVESLCRRTAELLTRLPGPVRRVSLQSGDARLEIEWPEPPTGPALGSPAGAAAAPAGDTGDGAPPAGLDYLRAPMVGTFYRAPAPGADCFVAEGDTVGPGHQIAIIEAMKLLSPVEADRTGRILEVLVEDGAPVEYDQPLFTITAEEAAA